VVGLPDRDRRLAHELSAGVLRGQRALDRDLDIERADPRLHDILRLGAYQLRRLTRVPAHAAVSTSVALAREAVGEAAARYVNQALRRVARDDAQAQSGSEDTHPPWLADRWRQRFGPEETHRLMTWNDVRPPLTLQPARWDLATLRRALEDAGIAVSEAPFGAGLRIGSGHPRALPGYEEGAFLVQDPAQALVVRFAAIPVGAALDAHMPKDTTWTRPSGGYFVWVDLPPGTNIHELADVARPNGVGFVPAGAFFLDPDAAPPALRLSFAMYSPADLTEAASRLGTAFR
jgi:16S rRNA (cytosine967-C5)-methyltransferase